MTSVQSGVKEAVERVAARMAESAGRDWSYFAPSGMVDDLRTLLAALSSQAEVMEAMASALEGAVVDLEQTFRWRGEGWECSKDEILGPIRTALSAYRSLNGDA